VDLNAVVIGASHAGVNFAFNLRQQGWLGRITLIDSDPELPYHRPPLSKKTLQASEAVSTPLKAEKAYTDNNLELCLGQTVTAIDGEEKVITLASGRFISFDKLVIATGCSAFIPPIAGLDETVDDAGNNQYFAMRTFADAKAIKAALDNINGYTLLRYRQVPTYRFQFPLLHPLFQNPQGQHKYGKLHKSTPRHNRHQYPQHHSPRLTPLMNHCYLPLQLRHWFWS